MKLPKNKNPSFWIAPQGPFQIPAQKPSLNPRRRSVSSQVSKYKPNFLRFSSGKILPRKLSPAPKLKKKSSPDGRKSEKKKFLKKGRKSIIKRLTQLEGKEKIKAPKLFKNQVFRDVYDEIGNHDRIIETIDISSTFPEITQEHELSVRDCVNIDKCLDQYELSPDKPLKTPNFFPGSAPGLALDHFDLLKRLESLE